MNILFLSTWFPYPPDNGSKIRVYHLLRALEQRHALTLLSFAFDTARPDQAAPHTICCDEIEVVRCNPFERGCVARALRFLSPSPIVNAPVPEMQGLVSTALKQVDFDVVIASTTLMATYALMAVNIPKVLEEHNFHTQWAWERYQQQNSALGRLQSWVSWQKRRRYDAKLLSRFDLCTMVSHGDKAATLRILPAYQGLVEVVPSGVDCQHNHLGVAQPVPNTLVFNGALTYSANYDAMRFFLTEIHPLIRQWAPDVSLTITGSTSGVNLAGLKLDESVHLSGYVDDIRPVVAGASVCLVPIRQGGGTRLKILEAMALGTPVVATSKGAEGLAVIDGQHILLADDPATFASRTLKLLQNPALRQRLATNARSLVEEQYDWTQIGQRFVGFVEDVAVRHRESRS